MHLAIKEANFKDSTTFSLDLRESPGPEHPLRSVSKFHRRSLPHPPVEIHRGLHASSHAVRRVNATTQVQCRKLLNVSRHVS